MSRHDEMKGLTKNLEELVERAVVLRKSAAGLADRLEELVGPADRDDEIWAPVRKTELREMAETARTLAHEFSVTG